jgi:hypothetical protein
MIKKNRLTKYQQAALVFALPFIAFLGLIIYTSIMRVVELVREKEYAHLVWAGLSLIWAIVTMLMIHRAKASNEPDPLD